MRTMMLTVAQVSSFAQDEFPRDHDRLYDREREQNEDSRDQGGCGRRPDAVICLSGCDRDLDRFPKRWAEQYYECWAMFVLDSTLSDNTKLICPNPAPSRTSPNNWINYCLNKTLTNGQQVHGACVVRSIASKHSIDLRCLSLPQLGRVTTPQ